MTDIKPAAGYIRISGRQERQSVISIEQQKRDIEEDAARRGYGITEWYMDSSTGRPRGQPGLRCLLDDSCSPERPFRAVYVARPSRLSRDVAVYHARRCELQKHGVDLLSAEKPKGARAG